MYNIVRLIIDDGLMGDAMRPFTMFFMVAGLALWALAIIGGGDSNEE